MKAEGREGSSTATTVYRILQSPAPICMFYFAHPFGISSPAATSGSTSSKAVAPKAPKIEPSRKPVPLPAPKYDRHASKMEIVRLRPDSRDEPKKPNGMTMRFEKPTAKPVKPPESRPKLKKNKNSNAGAVPGAAVVTNGGGHRVSRTPLTVKPHAKTKKRPNMIELDTRQIPLTPWPSTIWNRDFLIPPLLQVLAKQHGRKIPDIEQILRTVRSAWNTPKSQRSLSQNQDSRDSSSSNWDLSSSCDSYYCNQGRHHRMGAGTYATVMGSGPGLLRRRYSVPEIIMRKHTLAQQKSYDEPPHDSNHNNIVLNNKNYYPSQSPKLQQQNSGSGGPMTRGNSKASPILQRKQQQQQLPQSPVLVHRKSITRAASSVESGSGDFHALASTGSESNLATMKRQPSSLGGISRSQKCSSVNGINSSTNNNNNYIVGSTGVSVGLGGAGVLGVGGGGGDFSMRKSTLLRRMWSKEMRRYDRSGSWSPPLRRAPRRIYSIESILPPEGLLASGGGSGSSDGSSATTTTTSCKECAKLESQYNSNARGGKLAANESPKRLRLAGSLNNINLQKGDSLEALSRTSTPNNRQLISSEGLVDDSASVTTKSSKPEVSSTTGATNTPLIQRKEEVIHDRSKRNFVFMSTNDEVELDEADLTSSTSSIASQACVRPVGRAGSTGTILEASEEGTLIDNGEHERGDEDGNDATSSVLNAHDNESEISEFLKQEAIARNDDYQDHRNHRETPTERGRNTDVDVHSRKRTENVDNDSAPGDFAVKVTGAGRETEEGHFPLKKQIARRGSNASSSAISISAESTDSDCVYAGDSRNKLDTLTRADVLKNETRLDEYISNLLVDNLNNLLDTKEIVANSVTSSDQKNNNKQIEEPKSIDPADSGAPEVDAMKHKGTEKYIGGGGGVVCNSPPDHPSNKLKHQQSTVDKDSEKENEDTINNNRSEENGKISIHYVLKKKGLGEKQSSTNGFYLVPRNGSRDSDGLPSEIDLNGKYYFPSYGIDTDPSDNTDIASEPEVQIISKIGLGSVYRDNGHGRSTIVPRISALPRTESMEVQPSSNSAEEFDDLPGNNGYDSDTPSLVDSLDEVEITPRRKPDRRKSLAPLSPARASTTPAEPTAESTTKSESSDKSPRHEKGESFFVPIQDTTVILDEHIIVADTMPMRLKERLNNRQRLMTWKKEQESLKKHRKVMRLIEQRKFYGEPAIQVISTIDRAISRKEYIPPAEKKRVFGPTSAFTPKVPKGKKKGSASRTELGMLESYKIDARGNMQIQSPDIGATGATGAAGASTANAKSTKKSAKSPWGQAAERRQKSSSDAQSAPTTSKSSFHPATATATTTASSKTPKKTPADVRRKHVLKDVQQMTLYPHADLTPDIEGGPRRMYQKTEIQEGDKHIEILEIVECADSAPRRPPRVRSGSGKRSSHSKSRIPVPIYRWGRYRPSSSSRENSPLSTGGSNPKVDRMIADLLIEALSNPDDVGVKFVKSPEDLKDKSKRSPSSRKNIASNSSTPRRSANSGKYTQRFEVIPEERSSVSMSSSAEELSSGRKKHASPRRVSFDENHKILNVDEFESQPGSKLAPKAVSPKPSPKPSPKKIASTPTATPSPKASALKKKSTSTTSRGKAAIESDVVEEKGWIGFSTQHEDMATPINGEDDEDVHRPPVVVNGALEVNGHHHHHSNLTAKEHERRNIVKTIVTGNIARDSGSRVIRHDDTSTQHHIVDHFHHHQSVNISVTPATLTAGSVVSVDHVRSTAATIGSYNSCNGTAGVTKACNQYLAISANSNGCNRRLTSGEFSDESCFTDSLNVKPSPLRHEDTMISRELAIPVHIEQDIRSAKHGGHSVNELKSTADSVKEVNVDNPCDCNESIYPYRQIREENAWHVYETADCKVIQSKIEYYETSIHRTPLTENHQSLFGQIADRSPGSLRSALLNATFDNHELVRHELKPDERMNLTSSDTLDSHHIPAITTVRTPAISEDAPKTSETCSSCCFCNPELHKHSGNPSETCFYCQAKAHTPSKSFPAPPTPPNIQMSPIPPSPKTPIMELTPTPTLQEISLPPKKTPQPQKPRDHPAPPPPVTPNHTPKPSHNSSKDTQPDPSTSTGLSTTATSINGLYTETTKKTDHTHTKTKTKTSDTVSTKCSTTNEKIKRSYVPSTGDSDKLEEVSKKLTRKKSETTVLNRPKHVNSLNRTSSVVHSVQKEIKNELKTPIKVLPKTAKELSNRKERDKQINLKLPLDKESPPRHSKSKTTLGFESLPKDKSKPPCASSQSYDETTSSSSTNSSSNSSPFKNCAALPPATRWKHNSERNLTQLTMQKISAASKWGNKWRKAARQHEDDPTMVESTLSPIRRRPAMEDMLPPGDSRMNAVSATTAATTTTSAAAIAAAAAPSIVSGITQSTTNQGWTVTVAGNYNPDMAPDVEMKLSFPKQPNASASGGHAVAGGSGGSKRTSHPAMANGVDSSYQSSALAGNRKQQYIEDAHHIPGRGGGNPNYAVLDDDSYGGGSRGMARAALPPPAALNPKRTLSRSDGTAGGKDYRLPNVGTSNNVTARQNAKKAIKTMECSVVASATTKTVANQYHMRSHQHQQAHEQAPSHLYSPSSPYHHQQQSSSTVAGPPTTTTNTTAAGGGNRGGRPRAMSIQSLHPSLQNGGGGKFSSYNSHQPRYHDPSSIDYGSNAYTHGNRRMSLESPHGAGQLDNLSVMGNAIAPEHKPKVPTMSERDVTRRHHPCYTRNMPYFS
ncbi:uncharacterized protein LOC135717437 isoform X2 [Ochlerotatus camptorhynchus]|uniref:uncharacterized protein LOC135717437 isoform X2 n=1 Tax=Ochlerotatus camptorhynchus TaxID=644619 RepID=UPI0031DE6533